jgi:Protein of unknown function (DUF4238)
VSTRKNHHFVPQFYFRRFSADGRSICLLRKADGKTTAQASIKAQASKNKFYELDEVEKALGLIEGVAAGILRELESEERFTEMSEDSIQTLLAWLAMQRARTMAARQYSQAMTDKFAQLYVEMAIGNNPDLSDEERERLYADLPNIRGDPVQAQLMEIKTAADLSHELYDLSPVLLENRTSRPFVFGDAPVVFYNAHLFDVKLRGVLGMTAPGLMVHYPLTPNLALLLLDPGVYEPKGMLNNRIKLRQLSDVMALNALQMHAASDCVYFHDIRFAGYVEAIWEQQRKRFMAHTGSVHEAPGIAAETNEPMGDIVHTFQPQLPYRMTLSFLQYEVLDDRGRRFLRRAERDAALGL